MFTMRSSRASFLIYMLTLSTLSLSAQNYERIWFDDKDSSYGFYSRIRPAGPRIQGALVLFDGFGGNATGLYSETKLQNVAFANELLVISIPTGKRLFLDDGFTKTISDILSQEAVDNALIYDHFAIGGFSSGGTIALSYAERCMEHPELFKQRPRAVFTVDSPIDLLNLYRSSGRILQSKPGGWWLGEAGMIREMLDKSFGTESTGMGNYRKYSPFLQSDSATGREQFLKSIPYRTYHDVDIAWRINNRRQSAYESNMLDASELITRLRNLGNTAAEFVASKSAGVRSNGMRHPHSWSIVDEVELIQWVKLHLDFYPGDITSRYQGYDPPGWQSELIVFPIDFAPAIKYRGFEDLRFAPGCWDRNSAEKWAYTFAWHLQDQIVFNEDILKKDLETYYSGLTQRRSVTDKDDSSGWFPPTAEVRKTAAVDGDRATWSASMKFYDSQITKKPAMLFFRIHLKQCSNERKTILFVEVAGSAPGAPIWKQLNKINQQFSCATLSR